MGAVATSGSSTGSADGASAPIMPHISLSAVDLDRLYPPMRAPADGQLDDLEDDDRDTTLQSGMRIAGEIRAAMLTSGRTRRRDPVGLVSPSLLCVTDRKQERWYPFVDENLSSMVPLRRRELAAEVRRPPVSGGVLDGIVPSGTIAASTSYRCTAAMAATDVAVALRTGSSDRARRKSLATSDPLEGQSGSPITQSRRCECLRFTSFGSKPLSCTRPCNLVQHTQLLYLT